MAIGCPHGTAVPPIWSTRFCELTKPADIAVEQPTTLQLAVNLETAMGPNLSPAFLAL